MVQMVEHGEIVIAALERVKVIERDILSTGLRLMESADGKTSIFDLFAIATLNRAVAVSSAFHTLVSDFNMVVAGALLRVHLDTCLRYFASHLVEDTTVFAEAVIRGEPINKMIDRHGTRMTDHHLSLEFDKRVPGSRDLYERACGYVHFSDVHTASMFDGRVDREKSVVGIKISAKDRQLPSEFYVESCNTCSTISKLIIELVDTWIVFKTENLATGRSNE